MRENWTRSTLELEFSNEHLTEIVVPSFPGARVIHAEAAKGGLANTNIKLALADDRPPLLLRLFSRDPAQALKEFRIYELIRGTVPIPAVYDFAPENPLTGHPYILMEWMDGVRLETEVANMDDDKARQLGRSTGYALAAIHSHQFEHFGFLDSDLNVIEPLEMGGNGLFDYTRRCLEREDVSMRLGRDLCEELLKFVKSEAARLDLWQGSPALTHCDFGGSNILIDKGKEKAEGWHVSAVLDWEFALSATPFFDLGNLLRKPLGASRTFKQSLEEGYTASGGNLPVGWYEMSLLSDLTAWLEFMTREVVNAHLIADARRNIRETIDLVSASP